MNFNYHTFDLVYQKSVLFQKFHFHLLDININLCIQKQYFAIAIESSFKLFGVVGVGIILSSYYKNEIIKKLNDKIGLKKFEKRLFFLISICYCYLIRLGIGFMMFYVYQQLQK